ncbi:carbohydrate kinase family protein [Microvirga terricola]|uniref:Carbohydrate kinase n=1 Tax=Microvirga terricola TaxID=2719797 RepID=A0ABX0VGB6_9HYPH|nr:carbohydrate kinase [Microvirga terricola]NIX77491.1 carbohydrate kinase [Microvirga terricola]
MILVCGEALIDLFVGAASPAGLPSEVVAGGSPFNVALGLSRLGRATGFLSTLSNDTFGSLLASKLVEAGVCPSYVRRCSNRTTLSVVATSATGEPQYSFYAENCADRALTADALPPHLPEEVSAISAGSYALGVEPIATAIETLLRREAGSRVISLDPNVRPRVVGDVAAFRDRFERLLSYASIVKASDEDIELLYTSHDPVSVARDWLARGAKIVIVTRGADGPMAVFGNTIIERPAPQVNVVDTVGAGDTFHAAFLAWLDANGMLSPNGIEQLKPDQVTAALDFAAAAAAIVCTRRGANPPVWNEVVDFMVTGSPQVCMRASR